MDARPSGGNRPPAPPVASGPPASDLEEPPCPMCGGSSRQPVHRFGRYGVVRCRDCGLDYLSPRQTERAMLEVYQSGDYYEGGEAGYDSYQLQEAALRTTFRRVVRNLVAHGFAGGDLLEIGSGFGFFLDEARDAFRSVSGTEMSEAAAAAARGLGLRVVTGGLDALDPGAQFDCVFSGHVLEHIYEPAAFVRDVAGRLRPGGVLVLGTPDASSAWRRLLGSRWPSYKIPEHVVFYDQAALSRLLRQAGLADVRAFPYPHAFPSALIADRAGLGWLLRRAGRLRDRPLWLPATTVAVSGRRPLEAGTVDGA